MTDLNLISLAGKWGFALDPQKMGETEQWFQRDLDGAINLPGSLETNGYGEKVTIPDLLRLNRQYRYVGAAWYQCYVEIPEGWRGKHITLMMERCLWESRVWVNDQFAGIRDSLSTPHEYDLTGLTAPGPCRITVCVDNTEKYRLGTWGHGYSEDMQTIWNGIIGRIELRAQAGVYIQDVQVYPDPDVHKVRIAVGIGNIQGVIAEGGLSFTAGPVGKAAQGTQVNMKCRIAGKSERIEGEIPMEDWNWRWDEFEPRLCQIQVKLCSTVGDECFEDQKTVCFGVRNFQAGERQFLVNGTPVFLRGTLDCGSFPLTGYPAMDVQSWKHIYWIGKKYGLNHFRYHSWCPPEAAFIAADEVGIYLQVELPFFPLTNNPDEVFFSPDDCVPPLGADAERERFFSEELDRILDEYGNHPSFVLMCMGNELKGDYEIPGKLVEQGKNRDGRHLYTSCANNSVEPAPGIRPYPGDEYYVAHAALRDGIRSDRRCTNRFNVEKPETISDYAKLQDGIGLPVLSHEVGQWLVYPNFTEIPKYTGVLQPVNFRYFKESLESQGLGDQAADFMKASGKLAAILYREEIERSLRTPHYGGFQLLGLQDYHGQGSSTIGMLDAFWDSKGLLTPEEFRSFCGPVVVLARMPKRVWTNRETFKAEIVIANYGETALLNETITWRLWDSGREQLESRQLQGIVAPRGQLTSTGTVSVPISAISEARKMILTLELQSLKLSTNYDFWVYPENLQFPIPQDIKITGRLDRKAVKHLDGGGKILLLPENDASLEAISFTTVFWNTQLFKEQKKSLGILCSPNHPALANFPTEYHSNWQWWELLHEANAAVLNDTPQDYRPIVQVIDHPLRNNKEGLIFEAKRRQGKILVCTLPLAKMAGSSQVARQLLYSLIVYMGSSDFAPEQELPEDFWVPYR